MRVFERIQTFACAAALMAFIAPASAQTLDAAGHYEGAISSPAGEMPIQVDLSRSAKGEMLGTLTIPAQKLQGLPLSNLVVNGKDVAFAVATSGGGYFRGELAEGGISGEFSVQQGAFPIDLQRAGEARLYPAPKSAAIGKEIEGVWNGTVDVDGGMRVVLKLANQGDGTATGTFISVDEGNLTIPVAITQDGTRVGLTLPMIGSSYEGAVNAAGTEVTGTYTTSQGLALPLALKRAVTN